MYTKSILTPLLRYLLFTLCVYATNHNVMAQDQYVFEEEDLLSEQMDQGRPYLRFMDNDQLSSGIYVLKAGEADKQEPHRWDELYYVLEGSGSIEINGEKYPVQKGSIIFVPAHAPHRFVDYEKDLKLLVFFSKKEVNK